MLGVVVNDDFRLWFRGLYFDGGRWLCVRYFPDLGRRVRWFRFVLVSMGGGDKICNFGVGSKDRAASHLIYK